MSQLLVRNIDPKMLDSLKNRAKANHRSLQGEIKFILESSVNDPKNNKSVSLDALKQIMGAWQGETLTRPTQGDYEQRDELE